MGVFVRVVAAGIRYDERSNDRTACAQPCEKEISDFVFEHGKGTASYDVYILKNINNNDVHIKYINHSYLIIHKPFFALYASYKVASGHYPDAHF